MRTRAVPLIGASARGDRSEPVRRGDVVVVARSLARSRVHGVRACRACVRACVRWSCVRASARSIARVVVVVVVAATNRTKDPREHRHEDSAGHLLAASSSSSSLLRCRRRAARRDATTRLRYHDVVFSSRSTRSRRSWDLEIPVTGNKVPLRDHTDRRHRRPRLRRILRAIS